MKKIVIVTFLGFLIWWVWAQAAPSSAGLRIDAISTQEFAAQAQEAPVDAPLTQISTSSEENPPSPTPTAAGQPPLTSRWHQLSSVAQKALLAEIPHHLLSQQLQTRYQSTDKMLSKLYSKKIGHRPNPIEEIDRYQSTGNGDGLWKSEFIIRSQNAMGKATEVSVALIADFSEMKKWLETHPESLCLRFFLVHAENQKKIQEHYECHNYFIRENGVTTVLLSLFNDDVSGIYSTMRVPVPDRHQQSGELSFLNPQAQEWVTQPSTLNWYPIGRSEWQEQKSNE